MDTHREDFPVVIYWRPGCVYCLRLRGALGKDKGKATWVSIWADEEAAAFVRSINDGNESVPTVRIGEQVHTNPEPELVRAALR
ncbi:NrdH-redoxin [Janibacter sp. Soil728]|nr:NrdH-redoxin [Janibacter sp. Soil728]